MPASTYLQQQQQRFIQQTEDGAASTAGNTMAPLQLLYVSKLHMQQQHAANSSLAMAVI
jgi:hypothetical protein